MNRFPLQFAASLLLLIGIAVPLGAADAPLSPATAQSNKPLSVPVTPATAAPAAPKHAAALASTSPTAAAAPSAKDAPPAVEFSPPQEHLPLGRSAVPSTAPRADASATSATGTPAAPAASGSAPLPAASAPVSGSWMLQTLTALALVIGLIVLLRTVLQRLFGPTGKSLGGRIVEVLARSTIGPKTQVLFLRINQRVVVVGQTPAGLNSLTTLDDPEDVAWLLAQVEAARPRSISTGFRQLLARFDKDYQPEAPSEGAGDASEQFVDRTRDRLSGLITRMKSMKDRSGGEPK